MNCIDRLYCGPCGGLLLYGRLSMQSIFGPSLALYWHLLDWML
jgi:hypothetical protein